MVILKKLKQNRVCLLHLTNFKYLIKNERQRKKMTQVKLNFVRFPLKTKSRGVFWIKIIKVLFNATA